MLFGQGYHGYDSRRMALPVLSILLTAPLVPKPCSWFCRENSSGPDALSPLGLSPSDDLNFKIGEYESVAAYHFSAHETQGFGKNRSRICAGVKLAALGAGVNRGREIAQE